MGRDMIVPPHTAWRCPRCVACKRRVGALSWCANTRARAEREEGEGSLVWRTVVAWAGPVALAYHVGEQCPPEGEQKFGTTGAGAGCAPGRGGSFGSGGAWWLQFLVGRSFLWVRG